MIATVEQLSGDLAAELEANAARSVIDPATVPWRFSTLFAGMRSGAHYHHAAQDQVDPTLAQRLGAGAGRDKSAAMLIGSVTHAIMLDQPYAVYTGGKRQGGKWEEFRAERPGIPIANPRELAIARGVADAVRRHPLAHLLLDDMIHENTIMWSFLGRSTRSTPDARGRHRVVELKTTRCAEPKRFCTDAMFRGYHGQVALYADAVVEAGLGTASEVFWFAVENVAPFNVSVLLVDSNTLDEGRRMMRLCGELALNWERAGEYPGYIQTVVEVQSVVDFAERAPFKLSFGGEELDVE